MNGTMRSFLNKIKTKKKKKIKKNDKIKQLENELVKIKNAVNPEKLQNALKELYKIQVVDKNLHEVK